MNAQKADNRDFALDGIGQLLPDLREFYIDLHAHPELSMHETRTAALAAERLRTAGYDVTTGIAKTGMVGLLHAGAKENVIPDEAIIKLNVRTFDEGIRKRVLAAIERNVNVEAAASGALKRPEITPIDHYPLATNDREATQRVLEAFRRHFPAEQLQETGPAPASEDFGSFGAEWHAPSVFWFVGGADPDAYAKAKQAGQLSDIPTNHSPRFAPVIHPTLQAGVAAMIVAAQAWLSK